MMPATYLDSSAIVKLAIEEPESDALRRYVQRRRPLVSSALARTEVLRALLLEGEIGVARGRAALARVDMVRVNDRVLNAAGHCCPLTSDPSTPFTSLLRSNSAETSGRSSRTTSE